jgi:hypothetical protein
LRVRRCLREIEFALQAGDQNAEQIFPLLLRRHLLDVVSPERQGLVVVIWFAFDLS